MKIARWKRAIANVDAIVIIADAGTFSKSLDGCAKPIYQLILTPMQDEECS